MSFDTLAPYYRAMERVVAGVVLQRSRTHFLPQTRQCRRALLLGEGPGLFLAELLRVNPEVMVTCVERSPRMIAAASDGLRRAGLSAARVEFQQCDIQQWIAPRATFDLVATHFFLDCFGPEELERIVTKIAGAAGPQASWLLTDFRVPPAGWQRWRARGLLKLMYAFFRRATSVSAVELASPDALLAARGFQRAQRQSANYDFVCSELWVRAGA